MKNTKIIPLTSNTMFKELFGRIENKDILSFFLSNYLDIEYNLVYDNIIHLNTSLKIDNINDYKYDTDIIVTLNDVVINLEMNKTFWKGIENRNFSYITGLIGKQYISGKGKNQFKKINKHIQINLNNYNNPRNRKVQILKLKDIETNEELELLEIHNVNLEVIKEECYNKDVNELTKLEKVSKFLLSENSEELKGVIGDMDEILDKVMDLCNDERLIGLYNKEDLDEAIKEGRYLAGVDDGIEKGIEQGIEKNKRDVVINMLNKDYDIKEISEITNLAIEEIEKLKEEQK